GEVRIAEVHTLVAVVDAIRVRLNARPVRVYARRIVYAIEHGDVTQHPLARWHVDLGLARAWDNQVAFALVVELDAAPKRSIHAPEQVGFPNRIDPRIDGGVAVLLEHV